MSDAGWNDPKFGSDDNLAEEDRLKLERALQRQAEEAHRRAPGRSQADLHEYGTVSEGVEYGRPVPPTAREDWHAQQREQALAEQQDPIAQPVAEPSYSDVSEARARANEFGETLNEDPSYLESLHGDMFRDANQSFRAPERRRARRAPWHQQQRQQALAEQEEGSSETLSEQEALRRMSGG